jgi:hypothetical protein
MNKAKSLSLVLLILTLQPSCLLPPSKRHIQSNFLTGESQGISGKTKDAEQGTDDRKQKANQKTRKKN